MTSPIDIGRLNSLLRDDGYLGEVVVRSNSVDVPLLLDLAGERLSLVATFGGLEEIVFVGGLSKGAVTHPELVGDGLNVFSTGIFGSAAGEISLVLSWEGDRSFTVRAHSVQIELDR